MWSSFFIVTATAVMAQIPLCQVHAVIHNPLPSACWDTPPGTVYAGIWSTSGRYASYWNAYLSLLHSLKTFHRSSDSEGLGSGGDLGCCGVWSQGMEIQGLGVLLMGMWRCGIDTSQFVHPSSCWGSVNSLNIFTTAFTEDIKQAEEIFKRIANYLPDIKKSNSWTMDGGPLCGIGQCLLATKVLQERICVTVLTTINIF